jgi:uncharacterized membrane protein YbaN (DUF454 family)
MAEVILYQKMKKVIFVFLGSICALLGVIGVLLPVMPGMIFFAMAAYFFSNSSPALHKKLLALPYIGKALHDWEFYAVMTIQTKLGLLFFCFSTTVIMGYFNRDNLSIGLILLNFSFIALFSIFAIDTKES